MASDGWQVEEWPGYIWYRHPKHELFIHRGKVAAHRGPWPYTLYLPGGHPSGCASVAGGADTLRQAKQMAENFLQMPLPGLPVAGPHRVSVEASND